MIFRVVLADEAQRARDAELVYYSERSRRYAERWYSAYLATLRCLIKTPTRYPKAAEARELGYDLREALFGVKTQRPTHRLLFTMVDDEVRVATLRHHAQDVWQG